jgi:ABC-type Fe3+ transport system permease subunit
MIAVTALALAAAFLFALSAFLQQRAARTVVGDDTAPRDPGVLAAIAVSGVLIAVGVVGLANASSTRRLYRTDADGDERAVVAA